MKRILNNLPTILITSIIVRSAILGASVGDAIAILAISGVYCFNEWMKAKIKLDPTADLEKQVKEIKDEMGKLSISLIQKAKPPQTPYRF